MCGVLKTDFRVLINLIVSELMSCDKKKIGMHFSCSFVTWRFFFPFPSGDSFLFVFFQPFLFKWGWIWKLFIQFAKILHFYPPYRIWCKGYFIPINEEFWRLWAIYRVPLLFRAKTGHSYVHCHFKPKPHKTESQQLASILVLIGLGQMQAL